MSIEEKDPSKILIAYTRELLDRLDEFFVIATGYHAAEFSSVSDFDNKIKKAGGRIAPRMPQAFHFLDSEVRHFLAKQGMEAFKAAQKLGGMRLVLGGSSRFHETHLNSVRNTLLYADTVYIPDPVLPWLEQDRKEERYRHILLIKAVHCLLHLKPIVDANLPYPALVIFPSWEKTLEDNDEITQTGINQLVADVVANATTSDISTIEEVMEFSDQSPDLILQVADEKNLIVGPGGPVGESLSEALERYENDLKTWRSPEWITGFNKFPIQRKILYILFERIGPIYHLLENAQEFRGHPLMCVEQQAYYFQLVSNLGSRRLELMDAVKPETRAMVDALCARRFEWLGNVDMDALIDLRMDNENQEFREALGKAMDRLQASDLNEVDIVAGEICRELDGAIAQHQRDLRKIQERYNRIHGQSLLLGAGGLGVALMPALTPLLGAAAPLALAGKYGFDKMSEFQEKRELTRSLFGVLARAKAAD